MQWYSVPQLFVHCVGLCGGVCRGPRGAGMRHCHTPASRPPLPSLPTAVGSSPPQLDLPRRPRPVPPHESVLFRLTCQSRLCPMVTVSHRRPFRHLMPHNSCVTDSHSSCVTDSSLFNSAVFFPSPLMFLTHYGEAPRPPALFRKYYWHSNWNRSNISTFSNALFDA